MIGSFHKIPQQAVIKTKNKCITGQNRSLIHSCMMLKTVIVWVWLYCLPQFIPERHQEVLYFSATLRSNVYSHEALSFFLIMCHQHMHSTWQRPPTQRWEVFSLPLINPNVPYSKCMGSEGHNIHMEKALKKRVFKFTCFQRCIRLRSSTFHIFHMGIYFTYPPPETMDRTENC